MREKNQCLVCSQEVTEETGFRFEQGGVQLFIHESCLSLLGRVVQKAIETTSLKPPSIRPTSIAEFLEEKNPKSQPELLACIAYYLEQREGKIVEFTTKEIREAISTTREHIPDVGIALSNAIRRTPYLVRIGKRDGQHLYRLTKQGTQLVEELPR